MKDARTYAEQIDDLGTAWRAFCAEVLKALRLDVAAEFLRLLVERPRMFHVYAAHVDGTQDYGETAVVLARTKGEACAMLLAQKRFPAASGPEPRPDPWTNAWSDRQSNMRHNATIDGMAAAVSAPSRHAGDYHVTVSDSIVWGERS